MPVKSLKAPRMVALNADKLGAIAGGLTALGVALIQMFVQEAGPMTTIVRSAWAFVGAYAAVFFLVRTILRTTLFEMLAGNEARREARREARGKAAAEARGAGENKPQGETAAAKP
jgi:hypothetical protein